MSLAPGREPMQVAGSGADWFQSEAGAPAKMNLASYQHSRGVCGLGGEQVEYPAGVGRDTRQRSQTHWRNPEIHSAVPVHVGGRNTPDPGWPAN